MSAVKHIARWLDRVQPSETVGRACTREVLTAFPDETIGAAPYEHPRHWTLASGRA